ncbi:hypothetical protein C0991_006121 [Blastosporella zonata]|nr:hypothetical protein C0991_006121 [Blastosporella zonata]
MDPDKDHSSDHGSRAGRHPTLETSTLLFFEHEPYEMTQIRVREFLQALYWPEAAEAAHLKRLLGGGYNRIVGVAIAAEDLILKVPHFELVGSDVPSSSWAAAPSTCS